MSTLTDYKVLQVVTPDPTGAGGLAINDNFKLLADRFAHLATTDPTTSDDIGAEYAVGSRWYNTATSTEWICLDNTASAAVWKSVVAGSLPLAGGTMTGPFILRTLSSLAAAGTVNEIALYGTAVYIYTAGSVWRRLGNRWAGY